MAYTSVFGGSLIFPSQTSYVAISTAVDVDLQWPTEQQITDGLVVADFIDVNTAVAIDVTMPSALHTATGNKATFNNVGASAYDILDNDGGAIQTVAPGEQWVLVLTDNTDNAGAWLTFQMGASVSVASAAALAGAGIKAISTTLNQKIDSNAEAATPFTVVDGDRAACLIYTAGAGVCNLPTPGTVGSDWFFMLRNAGTGTLSVVPPSGLINGAASISMDPTDSCFIFTNGTDFFTIGLSAGSSIAFDFVSIPVAGTGDFTLSGANLNRISYRFTGILTGNRRIVVPATTQQYWVDNQTTGAFTLSISTLAQVGPPTITQGQTATLFCDGTNVLNANSSSSVVVPLTVGQGGSGATTVAGAQTNLQVPPTSRAVAAGAGMAGGGTLAADMTLNVVATTDGGLIVNADDIQVDRANTTAGAAVGYMEIPQNAQTGNYTLVIGDRGKHIYHASGAGGSDTYTIPANASVAFPIGTAITFINGDSNQVLIAITTDTMTLAGTTSTGTRTLAQNGMATAIKTTATTWIISGTGLS
jgi:hypothetical protein